MDRELDQRTMGATEGCTMNLIKEVERLRAVLNETLRYLHWKGDELCGDDMKGDGRFTACYNAIVRTVEEGLSPALPTEAIRKPDQEEYLNVIRGWKLAWACERDNDYQERSRRIDANMTHDLARRLCDAFAAHKY